MKYFICHHHVLVPVKLGGCHGLSAAYDPEGTY